MQYTWHCLKLLLVQCHVRLQSSCNFQLFNHPPSPTEPLPSSIDSWARGIVQQQSTSQLQSKIDSAQPVHILPFMIDTSAAAQSEQQGGEEVTDSHQEKQRRKSLLSVTTTSSIGERSRYMYSVDQN